MQLSHSIAVNPQEVIDMTSVKVSVSARSVTLPLLGNVSQGLAEEIDVSQIQSSGDDAQDMQACVNLVGGVSELIQAVNALKVSQEKDNWLDENGTSTDPKSAVGVIRSTMKTFDTLGVIDKNEQMRACLRIPEIANAVVSEGLATQEKIDSVLSGGGSSDSDDE